MVTDRLVRCVVVTPETTLLDESVPLVAFTAYDGEVGVLPGRAPLVARLGAGELRLGSGASARRFYIDGGFAQVRHDIVTILTARAKPADQLDQGSLRSQLDEINALVPTTDDAFADKGKRLERVRAQLRLAK